MSTVTAGHCRFHAPRLWVLAALVMTAATGARSASPTLTIGDHSYNQSQVTQLQLPKVLREISGLTFDDAGLLYAHNDEWGAIYQVDYLAGVIQKRFMLKGGISDDFEGIAYLAPHLYLISSTGYLYETPVGDPETQTAFRKLTNGLPCEVEGLSAAPDGQALLAACKNHTDGKAHIRIYRWMLNAGDWDAGPAIQITKSTWRKVIRDSGLSESGKLQATGLTKTPSGNLVLLAGRQNLLFEFTPAGEPVRAAELDSSLHRQPEGIAISRQGQLLIADEGDSKGKNKSRGVLSVHEPIR